MMKISPIINVEELMEIYLHTDVMIFDVSNGKNAEANYEAAHLKGAFFINLNTKLAWIKSDFSNGGRHPLPNVEVFAETLKALGITNQTHVIIYDDKNGANAAARFWWMLKAVGHEKVQVLNGGLNQAKKNNFPLTSKIEKAKSSLENYKIKPFALPTISINEVEEILQKPNYLILDVREKARYEGKEEPIDLIAGHIPGAINIPFTENLDRNGLFVNPNELKTKYELAFKGFNPENIIVHCGSGVTACHTLLSLASAGMKLPKLYVGSWSEWSRNNKMIAKTDT